jgi:4-hydroxy-tetrahydrodipicolinate synthase
MSFQSRMFTALITPFKENLEIDFVSLRKLVEHQIKNGVDGFVISGTTAESPNLSVEEVESIFSFIKEIVPDKFPLIIGAGTNSTCSTVERIQRFEDLNPDGFLIVVPYYNKPSQAGMLAHFQTAASATQKNIILYDIPGRSVVEMTAETIFELSKVKNIIGLKDATGSLEKLSLIKNLVGDDFLLFSGDDGSTVDFIKQGGHGVISVLSHLVPKDFKVCMYKDSDFSPYGKLTDLLFSEPNPTPVKKVLKEMGLIASDQVRLPLVKMSDQGSKVLMNEVKKVGLC